MSFIDVGGKSPELAEEELHREGGRGSTNSSPQWSLNRLCVCFRLHDSGSPSIQEVSTSSQVLGTLIDRALLSINDSQIQSWIIDGPEAGTYRKSCNSDALLICLC